MASLLVEVMKMTGIKKLRLNAFVDIVLFQPINNYHSTELYPMLLELGEGFGSVSFEDIKQEEIMRIIDPALFMLSNPLAPNIYHLVPPIHKCGILN
ncbi:hypothetical protein VP01_5392g1 [Puccinia sorghi]|uniref:Uncharacterized protein n=1 Tax=Puccinia sorghi TaxID=27349 RepID=A0A0L6UJX2_9BASI|nr:hypothetical protein VP01_5392g1 [Puccinia sorghi]